MGENVSPEERKRIGQRCRERLYDNAVRNAEAARNGETARQIATVDELCHQSGLSKNTIYKLHSGEFSVRTLRLVEGLIGPVSGEASSQNGSGADVAKGVTASTQVLSGGYSLSDISRYLGVFLTVRQGTTVRENLLTTIMRVRWDADRSIARFYEDIRYTSSNGKAQDYSQSGTLHMSQGIGTIHFLTSFQGAIRLMTTTPMQPMAPVMYGAILTQVPMAGHHVPTSSVVHLRRIFEDPNSTPKSMTGVVRPGSPRFKELSSDLGDAREAILAR